MNQSKSLESLFKLEEVSGKRVYIVNDHHKALAPWSLLRRELEGAPVLITLDHHTDTLEAFLGAASERAPYDHEKREQIRLELSAKLGWRHDAQVVAAVSGLRHDEHIDAAAQCGVIGAAFCIQLSDPGGWPNSLEERAFAEDRQAQWPSAPLLSPPVRPFTYEAPLNRIFTVPHTCYVGCERQSHNDDCMFRQSREILESVYLEDQLTRAAEMSRSFGLERPEDAPYILDIDLDVLHSLRAVEPEDSSTFYRLIRGAIAITIATEEDCVEELWDDDQNVLSSDDLLARTIEHIKRALG